MRDKLKNLKYVLKKFHEDNTVIKIDNLLIGEDFLMIAGPCSVESEKQIIEIAQSVKQAGGNMLRGGAYKPRSSPYSFQGLGETGLQYLKKAKEETGLPIITEILDVRDIDAIGQCADIFQIGTRNMQNFSLLKEMGKTKFPVLLKRGFAATIEEWLNCAEYILNEGNPNVILCERGIRTIETYTRNTLDLSAVAVLKKLTHLPVVVDPSHATGRKELVETMALCAIVAGCNGLEVEVHNYPEKAMSDSEQQIYVKDYVKLVKKVNILLSTVNKMEEV